MSADWTTCRVVRAGGELWGRSDGNWWSKLGYYWPMGDPEALQSTPSLAEYDPTPVLDADGLPVVHTVGDITARYIGRGVRVDGFEGELVALVALFDGIVTVEVLTDDDISAPRRCTVDTPCDVLP